MKFNSLTIGGLVGLAVAQDTILPDEVTDNQPGVAYKADLSFGVETSIQGTIIAESASDGAGVIISVDISGFPGFDESNYTYHIHAKRVPDDGNCTGTGAHFDPYHAGATSASPSTYKCDPTQPALCELGDLSGKHGNINKTTNGNKYSVAYLDTFLSTGMDDTAYLGNLSIVVHRQTDNKRLKCGNFNPVQWESWNPTDEHDDTDVDVDHDDGHDTVVDDNSTTTSKSDETYTWSDVAAYPSTSSTMAGGYAAATTQSGYPAAITTPSVYTGSASLMNSRNILGVSGIVTLVLAAIL